MRSKRVLMLSAVFSAMVCVAGSAFASSGRSLNLPAPGTGNFAVDDTLPDVTARVARISFIRGDVQIKRFDSQEWERATLNLPIVEGDEITTAADGRVEIQFNRFTHLRLAEDSYLKVSRLGDEGIAVSLPQGRLSVRVREFDIDRTYFEMDAPGTTVAVQRAGVYRLDAGRQGDDEVRVGVTEGGEARIYSETSGFTLKDGRSARVFITGSIAGEWDMGNISSFADEFDTWALDRDEVIARLLQNAYYDKYYDQDIYGAEDLNGYGEWIYNRSYGYVWRPFRNATSSYANWSPYRYGHWRWVPPYGWTWINDEPWGWATYHHGRWFYDHGYWYWSPYGYYRSTRSWWSPALVIITTWGGNICWYPLPYSYSYYNYNWYYYSQPGWGNHTGGGHTGGGSTGGPTPTPTPPPGGVVAAGPLANPKGPKAPPLGTVPPAGVVSVPAGQFGTNIKGNKTPPLSVANSVLTKVPDERTGIKLPLYQQVRGSLSTQIRTEKPKIAVIEAPIKTGAMVRKADGPLDRELRTTRVLGGRPPAPSTNETVTPIPGQPGATRKTGAVDRPPVVRAETPPETRTPSTVKPPNVRNVEPVRQVPTYTPPVKQDRAPSETVKPTPRYDPPTRTETPKYNPPPRQDPPPTRAPTRNNPPPAKSEPKPDKPAPSENKGSERKKDGLR